MRASSATRSSSWRRRTPLDLFRPAAVDHQVDVCVGGDLRQVRDDDDLVRARASRASRRPICTAARPPTPGVDIVEDHRGALGRAASTTSSASITRDSSPPDALLFSGKHVGAAVRGEAELDGVDAVVPACTVAPTAA
jgi:hypothetical protein